MPANWYSLVAEMTLSKATDTVVWELNELLAADRRAKAFSEASAAGDLSERQIGFKEAHWQQISSESDADEEESDLESVKGSALDDADVAATAEADADEEEEINIDQLLEAKFQEGVAEGIRQSNLESQQRETLAERFFEAVQTQMDELPRIWPVVTDLSLDIARTVCLQSLSINEQVFRGYLNTALENIEFPEGVPVEIKVSTSMAAVLPEEQLSEILADQPVSLIVDPDLKDGDISVQYDHLVIDRLLELEFDQLREQLVAQFPDSLLDS
tara:strand:- start:167 stop:982 length:816 start_codon:yes stop_codon:yes gene_type:complete